VFTAVTAGSNGRKLNFRSSDSRELQEEAELDLLVNFHNVRITFAHSSHPIFY
jgi:hypothetical protein